MRYAIGENSVLVGEFPPGSTVRIKILILENDNLLTLNTDVCLESSKLPGIYTWKTSNININNNINGLVNLLFVMTSEIGQKYYGKILYAANFGTGSDVDLTPVIEMGNEIIDIANIINARI